MPAVWITSTDPAASVWKTTKQIPCCVGSADVAHDDLDAIACSTQRYSVGGVTHEQPKPACPLVLVVVREKRGDQPCAEPTARARDHGDVWVGKLLVHRGVSGMIVRHDYPARSSAKRRAFRMAMAITEACGLTPGASGSNAASLTHTLLAPWTLPKLSVAVRL